MVAKTEHGVVVHSFGFTKFTLAVMFSKLFSFVRPIQSNCFKAVRENSNMLFFCIVLRFTGLLFWIKLSPIRKLVLIRNSR